MEEEREQGADIIVLKDEEGRDVRFEFLDLLEYDGEEYVILMQEDDDSGEVVILRLEGEDETFEFKRAFNLLLQFSHTGIYFMIWILYPISRLPSWNRSSIGFEGE